jgi:hypothetical protein
MKKLMFTYNRENLNFVIKEKEIFYTDRKFGSWVRCMPPPENFLKIVSLSRNRIPAFLIDMFHFTEEEIKEYNEAEDEEALAQIIIRDAKSRGCIYIKSKEKQQPKIEEQKPEGEKNATERS